MYLLLDPPRDQKRCLEGMRVAMVVHGTGEGRGRTQVRRATQPGEEVGAGGLSRNHRTVKFWPEGKALGLPVAQGSWI